MSAATRAEHPVVRRPYSPRRASDDNEMIAGVAWALDVLRRKWSVHLLSAVFTDTGVSSSAYRGSRRKS